MGARSNKRRKLNDSNRDGSFAPIECLPLEVLEQIYLESKNVHLLHASKHLGAVLSSEHVRRGMVLRCFRAEALKSDGFDAGLDPFAIPSRSTDFTVRMESHQRAMQDLRALLDEEWVTMQLVKATITDWMWQVATKRLRRFLCHYKFPKSDFEPASMRLREVLEKACSNMTLAEIDAFQAGADASVVPNLCVWWRSNLARHGWIFTWPASGSFPLLDIVFTRSPWERQTGLGTVMSSIVETPGSTSPSRMFLDEEFVGWTTDFEIIPPRLLAGPWTQSRGDLLKFLLDQCGDAYLEDGDHLSRKQTEAGSLGLTRAIRDGNFLGAYILLRRCDQTRARFCMNWVLRNGFASDYSLPAENAKHIDPWTRLSWSQENARSLLAIPLTTEHLRECIDNYSKHPATSLVVFDHLTRLETEVPPLPHDFVSKFKAVLAIKHSEQPSIDGMLSKVAHALYKQFSATLDGRESVYTHQSPKASFIAAPCR